MKNAETLNDLIEINNDRVAGYEKAIGQVEDKDLRNLFANMASQSRQFATEFRKNVQAEGGEPAEGTTTRGKIYRVWMEVKEAFSGDDRASVLSLCEYGEDAAQRAYESALEEKDLSPELRKIIGRQKDALRASHDKVKELRDAEKVS